MSKWRLWFYRVLDGKPMGRLGFHVMARLFHVVSGVLLLSGVVLLTTGDLRGIVPLVFVAWLEYDQYRDWAKKGYVDAEYEHYRKRYDERWQRIAELEGRGG